MHQFVTSIQHRILNRRRFQGFSSGRTPHFIVLGTTKVKKPNIQKVKRIMILDVFRPRLRKARKSGGWQHSRILPKKYHFWKVGHFSYWKALDDSFYEVGGHSQEIEKIELRKYSNLIYEAMRASSNSLNMYSFKIQKIESPESSFDYIEAFSLEFSAGYAFQHFVDQALAYIDCATPFLHRHSTIPIILPKPSSSFTDRGFLLNRLGISNPIIDVLPGERLSIKNLYLLKAIPRDVLYSVPYELIQNVSEKMCSSESENIDVVLILREERNRNFANVDQICHFLRQYCESSNLNFKTVYPGRLKTEEFASEIRNCVILIGIHGGALCNLLFLPPDSYILEFVSTSEGASLMHLAVGSGRKYLPIPSNFELGEVNVEIDLTDLKLALDCSLLDLQTNRFRTI